ncbi:S-formylglutathione hydrolase FrmB [Chitinophaga skermanii]|uniref:S-formylglutathione hydrolase FrmB n=1 Tax=Chitinophaga skermanii TaxID=331697 RepID=A0A327QDE2_9BACT|nr:alpha/beta hydrolase family protein [Chitinophaga skermanii]RAJ02589.1 S-formylglutathione hydrolase FrmB [Chitinophaga skermanii]
MKNLFLILVCALLGTQAMASKVDTIAVYSESMKKNSPTVVILPDSYSSKKKQHYPVVYLLHGYGGNYAAWVKAAKSTASLADTYQCIIVCPDGAIGSWYFDSPVDSAYKYETFVAKELVAYTDKNYRTIADREHRAITGLSMGGHGGLYLGMRHKDTFGAIGSMSGGVDFRPFPTKWDIAKRLGEYSANPGRWEAYTATAQVPLIKNGDVKIIIDCGVKDFFIDVNRQLHQKLLDLNIEHDYTERPGEHNWKYWDNAVHYQFLYFSRFFNQPVVAKK